MHHDAQSNPPAFVSEDESIRITKDDEVRLKIVGTRVDATEIVRKGIVLVLVVQESNEMWWVCNLLFFF